jgi:CRP/FNR family cyclic AMP-dependent transcriptional regulator
MKKEDDFMTLFDALQNMPEDIKQHLIIKRVSANTAIMRKGEHVQYVYILLKGSVKISNEFLDGHRYSFAERSTPSLIGEIETLSGQQEAAATVETITECDLFSLSSSMFLRWIKSDMELLFLITQLMATRLYPTSNNNGTIKFTPALEKMINFLLNTRPQNINKQKKFHLSKTRQQIADEIGTCTKTVDRCIEILKTKKMISLLHGKIQINDSQWEKLEQLSPRDYSDWSSIR